MKKLILIIISILAVAIIAYGTAFAMKTFMSNEPKTTSVNVETMPRTEPGAKNDTMTSSDTTITSEVVAENATNVTIKNNLNKIAAALNSYAANNRRAYPTTGTETTAFESEYLSEIPVDPITKKKYSISAAAGDGFTKITYQVGYVCGENGTLVVGTNGRQFGLQTVLTSGINYCVEN